ncbi:hypothetical protein FE257_010195 [Aspergillus nanangensis]|uniref:EamA domain-containing protein n=1 Tax=Aspergillus nanangensis TaxID=2582783 RepID=A0AAD4CKL0_ASPNN|nr:hypothetical protein FE257_010195 [Aspergillus nanangensis]
MVSPSPSRSWGTASHSASSSPRINEDEARVPFLALPSSPTPPQPDASSRWESAREIGQEFWAQGKGMILVLMSQFFGSSMNIMTQVLEIEGNHGQGFNPFQILFARMSVTVVASYLYMWYANVPHPFGTRPVFGLLVLRAAGGFCGVYGLYYSVQYLALSEATVLTFLAPILSCYACSFFIPNEVFTRKQQLAGLVSLAGVVLIARPFSSTSAGLETPPPATEAPEPGDQPGNADEYHHILAIIMGLVGVMGASCAYTTIRMIGQRAHPLVSVTYFSTFTTMVSALAMLLIPSVSVELPSTPLEWSLLAGLGVCGFLLQFLLTAGLSYVPPPRQSSRRRTLYGSDEGDQDEDKSNQPTSSGSRATSMLYTQMVFALIYDRAIWGTTLSGLSWLGSVLILSSALYVAMAHTTGNAGE